MTTRTFFKSKSWTKDQFFISTDHTLIPISSLTDAFNSHEFYWAQALPAKAMQEMIENSLTFGLYERIVREDLVNSGIDMRFIGIARCVTDFITFVYVTDVWVNSKYQGKGLGTWLMKCIEEVIESMPHLRRAVLFTADWKRSVPFYEKCLEMSLVQQKEGEGLALMERKGKGHPEYTDIE